MAKRAQGSALECFRCRRRLADDGRNLLDREVADHPQDQHIALIRLQPRAPFDDPLAAQDVEGIDLDVATGLVEHGQVAGRRPTPASQPPPFIDQLAVRDREHPRAKLRLGTAEGADAGEYTEEHLAGDVVWLSGALDSQVSTDDGRQVGVQTLERPGRAGSRRVQDAREPVADRQSGPP